MAAAVAANNNHSIQYRGRSMSCMGMAEETMAPEPEGEDVGRRARRRMPCSRGQEGHWSNNSWTGGQDGNLATATAAAEVEASREGRS